MRSTPEVEIVRETTNNEMLIDERRTINVIGPKVWPLWVCLILVAISSPIVALTVRPMPPVIEVKVPDQPAPIVNVAAPTPTPIQIWPSWVQADAPKVEVRPEINVPPQSPPVVNVAREPAMKIVWRNRPRLRVKGACAECHW